jgi:hypothetical protein
MLLSVPEMTHKSLQSKMEKLKTKLALLVISKLSRGDRSYSCPVAANWMMQR